MKYEVREKSAGRWTTWRDWYSGGGRLTRAAEEFFDGNRTGRISFKRPGGPKFELRVKK